MITLIAGLVLFLGVHSVSIVSEPWRNAMAARLGENGWKILYTVISIAGFVLIIRGYAAARMEPLVLYTPPAFLRSVTALLMLAVFPLALSAYLPGKIRAKAKHPLLAATKLWALAHLLSNGTLADVFLFGGFLAWAAADRVSLKRRSPRPVPALPQSGANDVIAVVGGLALYALFVFWAHAALFGVSPAP